VRDQFPNHNFIAVLELHTYSSLQPDFLPGYKGTLDAAESALVFLDPHVFELKKMPMPNLKNLKEMLGKVELLDNADELFISVEKNLMKSKKKVLLLMSSGNFKNLDWADLWRK
jgi:UDP-N-acetylmuramate: L-alanyl-gamma-D-glutamyl-meso-diaminopimelate ligase